MTRPRQSADALHWIVSRLRRHGIPFQVTGGLAARVYGSSRPLADIDLDVPEEALPLLLPEVAPYVRFGPAHYTDEAWDLELMTLEYLGQEIDLGGAFRARVFDQEAGAWAPMVADFSTAVSREVLGLVVPVVCREDLIAYKRKLGREVDRLDVAAMEAAGSAG